jgi:hypothetical protein
MRGHRWETSSDAAGEITTCARCGYEQHEPLDAAELKNAAAHLDRGQIIGETKPAQRR